MVVIVLVGQADRFSHQILSYFENKYTCRYFKEPFTSIKFELTNQDPNTLYLIPDLAKPERYEIYCLTRKNQQKYITLIDELKNEGNSSDKNPLIIKEFDGVLIEKVLLENQAARTSANERSKISLRSLSDLKKVLNRINLEFKDSNAEIVLQDCEERIIHAWRINPKITIDEVEMSYRKLINYEMKRKGIQ